MKKLILALSIISTLTFFSCSNASETDKELITPSSERTLPVQGFTFTVQADYMYTQSPGCYHVAIRVYMTSQGTGQVSLVAQSEENVGTCNRIAEDGCLGEYRGDYITKDDYVGGQCTKELFTDNPNIYDLYVTARNNAIAGH